MGNQNEKEKSREGSALRLRVRRDNSTREFDKVKTHDDDDELIDQEGALLAMALLRSQYGTHTVRIFLFLHLLLLLLLLLMLLSTVAASDLGYSQLRTNRK